MTEVRLPKNTFDEIFESFHGFKPRHKSFIATLYGSGLMLKFILEEEKPKEKCKTRGGSGKVPDYTEVVGSIPCPNCKKEEPNTESECRLESAENHIKAVQDRLSSLESEVDKLKK